jgi:AraC-like DNA-binding protein
MLREDKAMIGGCIEKMQAQSCGTCARRDDCSFVVPEALGFILSSMRRGEAAADDETFETRHPFLAFLGHVAKGIERRRAAPRAGPVRRMVERHLEPLLAGGPVRIEAMARELGFSRQTLYRRLKAEGTTYEAVLDALRHRLALRFIRDEALPVKEAAYRLGFSDPAAFSRAFKRWTGASPNALRGKKPH